MKTVLVVAYVAAVAAANLLVSLFGPEVSVPSAFVLVGMVLVLRDRLHLEWMGDPKKMFALIAAGGVVSVLASPGSWRIALASSIAFAISETVDYGVFSKTKGSWLKRSNTSNLAGAAVDSILFPLLAFGAFLPWIMLGQFLAKTLGGAIWSAILKRSTLVAAVLLLSVTPAHAGWLADVGVGAISLEGGEADPVAELFVATPELGRFRIYGVSSWSLEQDGMEPSTGVAAITGSVWGSRHGWFALNAGVTAFSFEEWEKVHPFLGATLGINLQDKAHLVFTPAKDLGNMGWSLVSKVAVSFR